MSQAPLAAIRNYQPGDERAWLDLIQAAPDFPYSFFNRSASLDALRVVLEHPYMDPAHNLFLAVAEGRFVGYGELWHVPERPRNTARILVQWWVSAGTGLTIRPWRKAGRRYAWVTFGASVCIPGIGSAAWAGPSSWLACSGCSSRAWPAPHCT